MASGVVLAASLLYLHTLPNPTYIYPYPNSRTEYELVDYYDFHDMMSYGYSEKDIIYRTAVPLEEIVEYYDRTLTDEGWQRTSRTASSIELQHPVSGYTIFVRSSQDHPDAVHLTIRRQHFIN